MAPSIRTLYFPATCHISDFQRPGLFFLKKYTANDNERGSCQICSFVSLNTLKEAHVKFKTPGVRHPDLKVQAVVGHQKRDLGARRKMRETERIEGERSVRKRCQCEQRNLKTLQLQQH